MTINEFINFTLDALDSKCRDRSDKERNFQNATHCSSDFGKRAIKVDVRVANCCRITLHHIGAIISEMLRNFSNITCRSTNKLRNFLKQEVSTNRSKPTDQMANEHCNLTNAKCSSDDSMKRIGRIGSIDISLCIRHEINIRIIKVLVDCTETCCKCTTSIAKSGRQILSKITKELLGRIKSALNHFNGFCKKSTLLLSSILIAAILTSLPFERSSVKLSCSQLLTSCNIVC